MRGLRELVFSVTNRCTARCRDCPIVHEDIEHRSLSATDMIDIISEILPWNTLKLVVFTGGEPFLLGNDLKETVRFAADNDILTRIVTNAYWASSKEKALHILSAYKQAGVSEINISCDDYHQEYIPLEYVKHANEAACELGVPALLAHRICPGSNITVDYLSQFLGVDLHEFKRGEENPKNNVCLSGVNVPIKNKSWIKDDDYKGLSCSWLDPCPSVLSKIIISPDKSVQICCGIASSAIEEFNIGTLEKDGCLLDILKYGNEDLLTNWLALAGPSSILEFVRQKDPTISLPTKYVNRCHLCDELFTREDVREILHKHAAEKADMVSVMRGILDWFTDDWATEIGRRDQPPHLKDACHTNLQHYASGHQIQ